MLRIHFTTEDLSRTHVAAGPDPLWEVVLSRFLLHEKTKPPYFQPWLDRLHTDERRLTAIRPAVHLLAGLAPQGPYFPDFLTPAESVAGLHTGLEAIARTPRRRVLQELRLLSANRRHPLPKWLSAFANDTGAALEQLTSILRTYHAAAIAPHDEVIKSCIDADRALRAREMLAGGLAGLFASMRPLMLWQPPVLDVQYDIDRELHLNGRGLRLVPSFFCHGSPVSIADPELTPVLIYPIAHESRWNDIAAVPGQHPLTKLMGTTRATVLLAVGTGATTTGLAKVLDTSPASVSRHTTVLREAGLIATHRHGHAVLHTLTQLGAHLLNSHPTRATSTEGFEDRQQPVAAGRRPRS